jgi:hypothetical protein
MLPNNSDSEVNAISNDSSRLGQNKGRTMQLSTVALQPGGMNITTIETKKSDNDLTPIFVITPTHQELRACYTIMIFSIENQSKTPSWPTCFKTNKPMQRLHTTIQSTPFL